MALVKASVFVQRMKRKYGANPVWVWDMIEENFNYIKGCGALLDPHECEELKGLIEDGLSEDD